MNKFDFKKLLPIRPEDSNKGTFGRVLNIAGSGSYTGAAYFSSISALKIGCGLVTLASTKTVLQSVSALTRDLIFLELDETKEKTISPCSVKKIEKLLKHSNVVSIGCGLSVTKDTIKFFDRLMDLLSVFEKHLLIDADGLNILASHKNVKLPLNTILTPHPKELSRLMRVNVEEILLEPELWVKKCCEKYDCITVLKLHRTLVADNQGRFYENTTGNSALSHGGSGDVLCGMISGLIAQGVGSFDACCLAVYLHGLTAEIASKELTEYSTLSSDLLNYIPQAIKTML